jgi:hypothetical protein
MLKYNGNTYENEDVEMIDIVIKLNKKASNSWRVNEEYVNNKLKEIGLKNLWIENPEDDFVFIQIQFAYNCYTPNTKEDLELLKDMYNKIKSVFDDTKINITCTELKEDFNEFDVTFDEFLEIWSIE